MAVINVLSEKALSALWIFVCLCVSLYAFTTNLLISALPSPSPPYDTSRKRLHAAPSHISFVFRFSSDVQIIFVEDQQNLRVLHGAEKNMWEWVSQLEESTSSRVYFMNMTLIRSRLKGLSVLAIVLSEASSSASCTVIVALR